MNEEQNNLQEEQYSLEMALELLNEAKQIALSAEDKYQEVLTLVDKIIKYMDKQV